MSRTTKEGSGLQKVGRVYEEAAQYVIDCKKAKNPGTNVVFSGNSARHAIGNILNRVEVAYAMTSTTGSGTVAGMTIEQQREAYAPHFGELWQRMQKVRGKLAGRQRIRTVPLSISPNPSATHSPAPIDTSIVSTPTSHHSPTPMDSSYMAEDEAFRDNIFEAIDGYDPDLQDGTSIGEAGSSRAPLTKSGESLIADHIGSFMSWCKSGDSIEDERSYLRKKITQLEMKLEDQQRVHNALLVSFYEIKAENTILKAQI
ncbi:hypothetical protein BGW38_009495 [Lunasporangiospora selenospora]|uniref:Uncharacterized protein n=1 Tax=Lunasporangiospora selenospora TaxID=979761 RepID=A0A9P6FJ93_9FUNG|nr:hypothetical protein BGW38_009495 [Lunasporangiospora selenospora]